MSPESDDDAVRRRVLTAIVDGEPLSVREVAIAADVPESDAAEALEALVADGHLRHTTVRGVDIRVRKEAEQAGVDLEAPVECYYPSAESLLDGVGTTDGLAAAPAGDDESGDADVDPLDRRLARMDVEGASEMMRDWRRDAVRAAYEFLRESGPADPEAIQEAVYPAHQAGFDDPSNWWDCVRPRLLRLPGVAVDDGAWDADE